jgi:mRNA interferase RelE/StbE
MKALDPPVQLRIKRFIESRLLGADNPRSLGDSLAGDKQGYWRYRVGDYRLICLLEDQELIILLVEIGHRREIYR